MGSEMCIRDSPHLIYIDESGLNLWTSRTRGRSRRGQRAPRVVGARCPNFTLILTVSSQRGRGRMHHSIHKTKTTADVFNAFLSDLLQRVQPNEVVTVLLHGQYIMLSAFYGSGRSAGQHFLTFSTGLLSVPQHSRELLQGLESRA